MRVLSSNALLILLVLGWLVVVVACSVDLDPVARWFGYVMPVDRS